MGTPSNLYTVPSLLRTSPRESRSQARVQIRGRPSGIMVSVCGGGVGGARLTQKKSGWNPNMDSFWGDDTVSPNSTCPSTFGKGGSEYCARNGQFCTTAVNSACVTYNCGIDNHHVVDPGKMTGMISVCGRGRIRLTPYWCARRPLLPSPHPKPPVHQRPLYATKIA